MLILPRKRPNKTYHIHAIFGELGTGKSARLAWELMRLAKLLNTEALIFSPGDRLPEKLPNGSSIPRWRFDSGLSLIHRAFWPSKKLLIYTGDDFEHFLDIAKDEAKRRLKGYRTIIEPPKPLLLGIDEAAFSEGLSSEGAKSRASRRFRQFFDSLRHNNVIINWCSPHPSTATHHIVGLATSVSFYRLGSNEYMRHFRRVRNFNLPLSPMRLSRFESIEVYNGESKLWAHYPFNPLSRRSSTRRWGQDLYKRKDIEVDYID